MCQPGSQGFNSAVHVDHCTIHINYVRCVIPSCRENLTFLQVELESIQLSEAYIWSLNFCRLLVIVPMSAACAEDQVRVQVCSGQLVLTGIETPMWQEKESRGQDRTLSNTPIHTEVL